MPHEPLHTLLKAIVARWAEPESSESSQSGDSLDSVEVRLAAVSGPWQGERPPDATGNPESGDLYPYCIIQGSARMVRMTCGKEHWDHQVVFQIFHTTPKLCADYAALVAALYDSDSLSLTLDEGSLISHRPVGERRYVQVDKTVHMVEMPYFFKTERSRVA